MIFILFCGGGVCIDYDLIYLTSNLADGFGVIVRFLSFEVSNVLAICLEASLEIDDEKITMGFLDDVKGIVDGSDGFLIDFTSSQV